MSMVIKIAAKAASQNQTPQEYVDQTHVNFKKMIADLNISVTDFIRTTDAHHVAAVQYIWQNSLRLAIFTKVRMKAGIVRGAKLSLRIKKLPIIMGFVQITRRRISV